MSKGNDTATVSGGAWLSRRELMESMLLPVLISPTATDDDVLRRVDELRHMLGVTRRCRKC